VGEETRMLLSTPALEVDPEDRGLRSTRQTLQPAEARQGNPRVAVLGTRERVPGRQAVVDHPFVIGRPDGPDES
jgi:hypothetical protein